MFKASESSPKAFEVLDFSVQRFDRAIGKPAVVKSAGPILLDHDKGVQDRLFITAQKAGEFGKDAVTALKIKVDEIFKYICRFHWIPGILLVEYDIFFLQITKDFQTRVYTELIIPGDQPMR